MGSSSLPCTTSISTSVSAVFFDSLSTFRASANLAQSSTQPREAPALRDVTSYGYARSDHAEPPLSKPSVAAKRAGARDVVSRVNRRCAIAALVELIALCRPSAFRRRPLRQCRFGCLSERRPFKSGRLCSRRTETRSSEKPARPRGAFLRARPFRARAAPFPRRWAGTLTHRDRARPRPGTARRVRFGRGAAEEGLERIHLSRASG